jgi:transcriptional regulator with PAS, ATPase and Fis domain
VPNDVPHLRRRPDDIPILARHFIDLHSAGRPYELTYDAIEAMTKYAWPGNVRELENAIKRGMALAGASGKLSVRHLIPGSESDPLLAPAAQADEDHVLTGDELMTLKQVVDTAEKLHIRKALAAHQNNRTKAAQSLGISRKNLWEKMKEYRIE